MDGEKRGEKRMEGIKRWDGIELWVRVKMKKGWWGWCCCFNGSFFPPDVFGVLEGGVNPGYLSVCVDFLFFMSGGVRGST